MKHVFLFVLGCMMCGSAKAQHQQVFDEYLREAGDQAEMFVGKVETGYPSTIYVNHPFWASDDFVSGDVWYKEKLYRNVELRYDAYLKQLVVRTPVKRLNVIVQMDQVGNFTIGDAEYSRRNDEFMCILYSSSRLELVERMNVTRFMDDDKVQYEFRRTVKYYVLRDGQMHEVNKMKSVVKLYPELKKDLTDFAKTQGLDFKKNPKSSLVNLVEYADRLLAQP